MDSHDLIECNRKKDYSFSVITVTYNCVKTIKKTIESVIVQKYPKIEYIIIDGDSTDGTKEIIKRYASELSFWISESDLGIYNAMNKGIQYATGDIVCFINGDDYYVDDSVFNQVNREFQESRTDIVANRVYYKGKAMGAINIKKLDELPYTMVFPHQGIFVRRELFIEIGLFNENYRIAADYDWILRAYNEHKSFEVYEYIVALFSPNGVSDSTACFVEQCEISIRNMRKEGKYSLIPERKDTCIDAIRIFLLLKSLKTNKNCLDFIFKENRKCSIWGIGNYGQRFYEYAEMSEIRIVSCIDSGCKVDEQYFHTIPVTKYNSSKVTYPIIITTTKYDKEISLFLEKRGKIREKDFYSIRDIAKRIVADDTDAILKVRRL